MKENRKETKRQCSGHSRARRSLAAQPAAADPYHACPATFFRSLCSPLRLSGEPLQTLSEIRQLLADRGLRPKHRLGQNFLHDKNQLAKLIEAASVRPGDLVLEVGPGTGTLTEALLEAGADVIACEIDEGMASIVAERFGDRITLVRGDALGRHRELNPAIVEHMADRPFKLVANLPYQIASPLMTTLLIDHPNCTGQFVTIQKEVADRLIARPSTKAYGPLGVIVQAFADVRRIGTLSPGCFWPEPDVTSAMVAIAPRAETPKRRNAETPKSIDDRDFARFVTDLFTKRRKQLGGGGGVMRGLGGGREHPAWQALAAHGITPDLRPEALTPEKIVALWPYVQQDRHQ